MTFDSQWLEALEGGEIGTWRWCARTGRSTWSPIQESLFGFDQGTYDGTEEMFLERLYPEDRKGVSEAIRIARAAGQDYVQEYRVRWPDGSIHWLKARGRASFDAGGKVQSFAGVTWDTTERKLAEQTLIRQAQELSRSNANLQQFAYEASHDLREPIRSILTFTQILVKRYQGKLDADAGRFLGFIEVGARHMSLLVQSLFAYSQSMSTEAAALAPVDMEDVLRTTLANLHNSIAESSAFVTSGPLPAVRGDQVRLAELLQNLIGNSIKYRSTELPRIHVSATKRDGAWLFSIADNGIGIDAQHHEYVFGIFKRLHTHEQVPGTGIGLAICKNIVEKHGGRIWVESVAGGGSTFYFTLPQLSGTAAPAPAANPELGSVAK